MVALKVSATHYVTKVIFVMLVKLNQMLSEQWKSSRLWNKHQCGCSDFSTGNGNASTWSTDSRIAIETKNPWDEQMRPSSETVDLNLLEESFLLVLNRVVYQVCFPKESVHGTLKSIRQNLTSWEFTPKTQGLKLFLSKGAGKTPQIVEVVTSSRRVDVYIKCFYLWVTFPVSCWKNRKNQLGICWLGQPVNSNQWRNRAWWMNESTLSVDESSMQG